MAEELHQVRALGAGATPTTTPPASPRDDGRVGSPRPSARSGTGAPALPKKAPRSTGSASTGVFPMDEMEQATKNYYSSVHNADKKAFGGTNQEEVVQ